MRALMIGTAERTAIAEIIAKASERVTPRDQMERAAAHKAKTGDAFNAYNEAVTIDIPLGFTVTYTHEEQPGAVCRHMSISVAGKPGDGPNPHAVAMLMQEFGFKNAFGSTPMWLDTLRDGRLVVNVLEPLSGNLSALTRKEQSA